MYNQDLAEKIVQYLGSAFPDKVQLSDLTDALTDSLCRSTAADPCFLMSRGGTEKVRCRTHKRDI